MFLSHGQLISGLSWGHIISNIDLSQPKQDLSIYVGMVEAFAAAKNEAKDPRASQRLKLLIHNCKNKVKGMDNTLQEIYSGFDQIKPTPSLSRPKRQLAVGIAALGGLITGSIITSLFSQFKSSALTDILDQKVDVLTSKVKTNSIQIAQNQEDIKRINQTLAYITQDVGLLLVAEKEMEYEMIALFTNLMLDEQNSKIDLLAESITQIFAGKLHRGLIDTEGLRQAYDQLKNQAQRQGLIIGSQNLNELYQLPASFLYDKETNNLHIILHVPLYREAHILSLYRYVPTPIPLPTEHGLIFMELDPKRIYLARSRDGTLTRSLTLAELDDCLSIGHAYFCDDQALGKPKKSNCLNNLFSGINNNTFKLFF